jgi:putative oxygen-independent coproporphyrinogen III oxidase
MVAPGSLQLPPLSLYVHLPWCERKCPYCDFNSHEVEDLPEQAYIDALLRDLETEIPAVQGRAIGSIFIGGGTPSLFSGAAISRLLRGISNLLPLSSDCEITMEANPGSAEVQRFAAYRAAGVNRLSLGIQSFDTSALQRLGRVHNPEQALAAISLAKTAGFARVNLDLMHGLPEQTSANAQRDLEIAIGQDTEHLSWYQLTIEPNTAFQRRPPSLPDEDVLGDIQAAGEQLLGAARFSAYEVSAWSRDSQAQCRHNLNYWGFGDYLAIGAGAHGKCSERETGRISRYWKTRTPRDYLSRDSDFRAGQRVLTAEELPGEFMMNALRLTEGVPSSWFTARTGLEIASIAATLNSLQSRELVSWSEEGHIAPSALGRRFLDAVVAEFF